MEQSELWIRSLLQLTEKHPQKIIEIRGKGYLLGVSLSCDCKTIINQLEARGLLVLSAGKNVLRLLPPLTVSREELSLSVELLDSVLSEA